MRLARLDLDRYGRFTDHRIDFGPRRPGHPDFHIVYGPNEAGKTTAFAAFLDLLFGIEHKSRYGFIHPYPTMRIAGTLELSTGRQDLVRLKRPQGSLFDAANQPVAEALIAGDLGGMDRAAYRTMFSLDDETLEAGGDSILASKGDLGELLFSSSAGLANLSETLVALRLEADGFHKPKKHGTALAGFKARLADLKTRKEELDTYASAYAKLQQERDRGRDQYEEALKLRGATRVRMDELERQLTVLPRLAELRSLRHETRMLPDRSEAPAGWAAALPEIERREIEGATELKGLGDTIANLAEELQAVPLDTIALDLAPRVERLAPQRARYVTAEEDLPDRRLAARSTDLQIEHVLIRLGRPADAALETVMLGAAVTGPLREMIETRSGVMARLDAARDERDAARRRLADIETEAREAAPASGATLSELAGALAVLRSSDHRTRLTLAERALPGLGETYAARLRDLKPWPGDAAALRDLATPDPDAFDAMAARRAEAEARLARETDTWERLSTEQDKLRAEVSALDRTTGVVGDHEAAALRAARDRAWSAHRATLDAASAETFEDLMRRDDIVAGARFGSAADVARLRQIHLSLAGLEVDLQRTEQRRDAARLARDDIAREIAGVLTRMVPPLPDGGSAPPLGPWLARRRDALAAESALRQTERDRDVALADQRSVRARLIAALEGIGLAVDAAAPDDRLLDAAQTVLDSDTANRTLRQRIEGERRACVTRETALRKAVDDDAAWSAAWAATCGGCWIGESGRAPAVESVREMLKLLGDLAPLADKRADLGHRIAAMERDQASFADEVTAIAALLGIGIENRSLPEIDDEISRRLARARQDEDTRQSIVARRDAARKRLAALALAIGANERRKAEMTTHFGVETLAEVGEALRDAERRADLLGRIAAVEREVATALRLRDADEAEAALDGLDRAALEADLAELGPRFDDEDARLRDLHARHVKACDAVEAIGGDDAVARIESERRTIILEVEDRALRYLRLRAGVAAAEQALRHYRDRHRSVMMNRASDAFREISRGAYRGLATQPGRDAEILMGVAADGSTKVASDLSKGTRFQLYLALRIAGYHEFAANRRVVPFVADDIMETFDDFRAEEAFRLFAGMAEVGQVIYLTHHRHLVDIARSVCPDVTVHDLSVPMRAAAE